MRKNNGGCLQIFTYNVHSILSEVRLEMLLQELENVSWDLLVLTETWKDSENEVTQLKGGYLFFGSGGVRGKCGVGFLVHTRLRAHRFKALSPRLATLDVNMGSTIVRMVAAYLPDTNYSDSDFDDVLLQLDEVARLSKRDGVQLIVAGDFNVQVGQLSGYDDPTVLGQYGFGDRTPRGETILQWCRCRDLILADTVFAGSECLLWTYKNGHTRRHLDYFLVERGLVKTISSCFVFDGLDIGSDHRPLRLTLSYHDREVKLRKGKRKSAQRNVDDPMYRACLDELLRRPLDASDINEKICRLEEAMVHAAAASNSETSSPAQQEDEISEKIKSLIEERRAVTRAATTDEQDISRTRARICKDLQKLTRQRLRLVKCVRITKILSDFRGLRDIAFIKDGGRRKLVATMVDSQGQTVSDRQEIADVFATFYECLYKSHSSRSEHLCPNGPCHRWRKRSP